MRWEGIFEDLEAQFEGEWRRELDAEVAERTRAERAQVGLLDRLTAARGDTLRLHLLSGSAVDGALADLGGDWLLLRTALAREALVPLGAVVAVSGLSERASSDVTARRFRLGYALRGLSRDRATIALTDVTGRTATGTIDRVGSDALDLSEHAVGEARRSGNIVGRHTVPFAAVAIVESR